MIMKKLVERVARDLVNSSYAIALTGAGISTESGVPDFRGPSGIWTKDPEAERKAYQVYQDFLSDPKEYWEERLNSPPLLGDLGKIEPNPGHYALADLEKMGILKQVITQNVDNLHRKAGNKNVLEYHGNAFKLRCISCNARFDYEEYDLERLPPLCKKCGGVIKPDIVYFGEPIPSDVARQSLEEAWKCDLMLICGTSAVVHPFANLPRSARRKGAERKSVTIIEINAEPTPLTTEKISDYLIQGRTGEILPRIVTCVSEIGDFYLEY